MATASLHLHYRPLRIGFLVRHGNMEDVVDAARLNTALWGGVFNPIVPVGAEPDCCDDLVRLFHVDVLHPVAGVSRLEEAFAAYPWLAWPRALGEPHLVSGENDDEQLTALDVLPIMLHYWEHEFLHVAAASQYARPCWDASDPLAALLCVEFGGYPDVGPDYVEAFGKAMRAERIDIGNAPVPETLADRATPIHLAHEGLVWIQRWPERGVYVGRPDHFDDIVKYWNLRASGRGAVFWPLAHAERWLDYARQRVRGLLRRHYDEADGERAIRIWAGPEAAEDGDPAKHLGDVLPDAAEVVHCPLSHAAWDGLGARTAVPHFEPQTVIADLEERGSAAPYVTLALPEQPPWQAALRRVHGQHWVVSVRSVTEPREQHYTLSPPMVPQLNEWYARCSFLDPSAFRAQPDGFGVLHPVDDATLHLVPIDIKELIARLLEHAGISAAPSRPGLIAERLIRQLGGVESCRVFKIPGVRKLLREPQAHKGITRKMAEQLIQDKPSDGAPSFDAHRQLHIELRDEPELEPQAVFDFLLKKDILRPGLLLLCPNCTLDFWAPADSLRHQMSCELCGHQFGLGPQLGRRGGWRFRLSGLFGRADQQHGAVPVALTLLQLQRTSGSLTTVLHSTALELSGACPDCESDLVVVRRDPHCGACFLLGECKTRGEISADDICKLLRARDAIRDAGLDCYLIFSKTSPEFTENELERFRQLHADGVPLILFTAAELDPYHPYYGDGTGDARPVPYRYAHSFGELAANSASLYLGPPPVRTPVPGVVPGDIRSGNSDGGP